MKLLRSGANVEAKFGKTDTKSHFQDQWDGGWPLPAPQWTPVHALANSSRYPDPPKKFQNTIEHLDWAQKERASIPKSEIELRNRKRVQILYILLSHGCDINVKDDWGATPLYNAIYSKHEEMAKTLLDFQPDVNTKTGIYIDGAGGITPLHRASWSPELTLSLIHI